jgi:HAD superfamily hydrolase (TIGR01509 family)
VSFALQSEIRLAALDAMGVIYAEADDGHNLLYPFIVEKGGCRDIKQIVRLWTDASLGRISSGEFWISAGLDPALEDEYLQKYRLFDGLLSFIDKALSRGIELWCLSNNLSEWSKKLHTRFGLDRYIKGSVISGAVGFLKPDPAIYRHLMTESGFAAHEILFVDDRLRNVRAADSLGIHAVLFNPEPEESQGHSYTVARNFAELLSLLRDQ